MNRNELEEKLLEMGYGDVYSLEILNKDNDTMLITFFTKTRWFDSFCYIIGGTDDNLKVSEYIDDTNKKAILSNLLDEYIEENINEKHITFELNDKSYIEIRSDVPSMCNCTVDNFTYY